CHQWNKLYPQIHLLNAYGPTECSDDIAHYFVPSSLGDNLKYAPLGTPLGNLRTYILDPWMKPVPVGVAGEIYIGGTGVGRGYLNRSGLTAERFVPDPFATLSGSRLYRTGDRGRRLQDGTLEFLGRFDHQVKLRGLRVELTEVEVILNQHDSVRQSAVIVQEDDHGDHRLVGYVVGRQNTAIDDNMLRSHMKRYLPNHMVPSVIVALNEMPLTANEKIDREALRKLQGNQPETSRSIAAPRNQREAILTIIWCDTLGLSQIGIHDNFFELGGHSLLATRMVSRIRNEFGVKLPLRAAFERPTVAELAEAITELQNQSPTADVAVESPRIERVTPSQEEAIVAQLDHLSEEEIDKLLGAN
ncbi:MAG TPA: phosphopantetheine-binding protein, partial [Candidatus Angelobacter sp.]